jgi:hypothetical protein
MTCEWQSMAGVILCTHMVYLDFGPYLASCDGSAVLDLGLP